MTTRLAIRALAASVAASAALTALSLALGRGGGGGGGGANDAAVSSVERIVLSTLSGVLYVAALWPLAVRQTSAGWARVALLFIPLYLTGTVADLVEAFFFTTLLTPFTLVAALVVGAIPSLVIAAIVAALVPRAASGPSGVAQLWRQRSMGSWVWRLLLAGLLYVPAYYAFAALVTPIEHQFYSDPAFIAQLHTQVPPDSVIVPLEAARGVLFALGLLPLVWVLPGRRWSTLAYLALIGFVVEALVPLIGRTSWPLAMRLGNLAELTGDAVVRAAVVTAVLCLPPLLYRVRAEQG